MVDPGNHKFKNCSYAKSDMTPCYLRDGETALAAGVCVGCSHSVQFLERNQPEQPIKKGVAMFIDEHGGVLANPEQPNPNSLIVKTIQQRMHVITNELQKLKENTEPGDSNRKYLISQALEDIDTFERTTLFELQKEFE